MTSTSEPVAVIGVGTMGHGMAVSALRAGIATVVWDRTPEAARGLAGLGAEVAHSAADAARRAAIVVTMVPDADAVLATARDEGMLSALARLDLGANEHDRGCRYRARGGAGRPGAARHHARRRAGLGQQGPGRAR
jgi:D-arabinose 1-dehydrogenase-like Zn-dependent alcohol dehydrogenase